MTGTWSLNDRWSLIDRWSVNAGGLLMQVVS